MARPITPPRLIRLWTRLSPALLPFADAASAEVPLPRLLRLALFQVSVGMAAALLIGTLNRVMIVEMHMASGLVALMVALPLLVAPWRAFVGYRSDTHRSALGWRRVPYLWFGTLLQFGGLSILPFALLLMAASGEGGEAAIRLPMVPQAAVALAFLMVGLGMQTTQTAGLALATDLSPADKRPRVVALMYLMLLLGILLGSIGFSLALVDFSPTRLVAVVQGSAVLTMLLNGVALWKQEARGSVATRAAAEPPFGRAWAAFLAQHQARRYLVALGLGTAGFAMQDVVLEPYGGSVLGLSVSATSLLTAGLALGSLLAFGFAARQLQRGADPYRLAALGVLAGIVAFAAVIFSAPLQSTLLFRAGTFGIGLGGGLYAVSMLVVAMGLKVDGQAGLALGAWGAVQAGSAGLATAAGGLLRDLFGWLSGQGLLGPAMTDPSVPYSTVYHIEIALLFAALVAIGPLVRSCRAAWRDSPTSPPGPFGLAGLPG
ncbi:BCD family MFS transporter [Pseudacidovorax sp. RU35E]|uniref:BCD family MFS transporter n=1 Tax=Pseudacidovorax sp. RU35E TaxID=1907403 RepID=UPI0009564C5C|nr:BCD family MFS transporter [Pseudacidovorax sp. RU35E]SIR60145.1 MFS transporter, BCD family, chlorophyll transporter [Pseudacidovorax sp. RU35E]